MTSDEARSRFDDAFEGELDPDARAAFERALAVDPELARAYEEFVTTMRLVRGVGLDAASPPVEPLVDAVHTKLRVRSRGRFYRDRFSTLRNQDLVLPFVLAIVAAIVVAVAWAGHHVVEVSPATEAPE